MRLSRKVGDAVTQMERANLRINELPRREYETLGTLILDESTNRLVRKINASGPMKAAIRTRVAYRQSKRVAKAAKNTGKGIAKAGMFVLRAPGMLMTLLVLLLIIAVVYYAWAGLRKIDWLAGKIMPSSCTTGATVHPSGFLWMGGADDGSNVAFVNFLGSTGTSVQKHWRIAPHEMASALHWVAFEIGKSGRVLQRTLLGSQLIAPTASPATSAQQAAFGCGGCGTTAPAQPSGWSGSLGRDPIPHPVSANTTALIVSLAKGLGYDLTVTSTFREGGTSYHAKSEAVDFSDGTDTPGEMGLDKAWAVHYGAETAELIHAGGVNIKDGKDVGDGMGMYGAQTMSEHHNHVHIALSPESVAKAAGGVVPASRQVTGAVHADRAVEASQAAAAAQAAGFPSGELVTAVAVKLAESHGWDQVNSIGAAGGWQILRSAHPEFAAQWADGSWSQPAVNATMAYSVWKAAGSWRPWTTFTGADTPGHVATYTAYLPDAQAAVAGVGVTPVSSTCAPTTAVPASYSSSPGGMVVGASIPTPELGPLPVRRVFYDALPAQAPTERVVASFKTWDEAALRSWIITAAPGSTVTWLHEPEQEIEAGRIDPNVWAQRQVTIAQTIMAVGRSGSVLPMPILMRWTWAPASGRGAMLAALLSPAVLDALRAAHGVIGFDAYAGPQDGNDAQTMYGAPAAWATAQGLPWAVAETGSRDHDPQRWVAAFAYLAGLPVQPRYYIDWDSGEFALSPAEAAVWRAEMATHG